MELLDPRPDPAADALARPERVGPRLPELIPVRKNGYLAPRRNPVVAKSGGLQVGTRAIVIAGKRHNLDPQTLMRMIKRLTQSIGEYNVQDDAYASVIVGALRKARGDLVSSLEHNFRIHWQIEGGQSVFSM